MKRKMLKISLLVCLLLFAIGICGCIEGTTPSRTDSSYEVGVMIRECEGMSIVSEEAFVKVASGSNVTFKVQISEDYYYLGNTAGASYNAKTGNVKLSRVFFPTTIDLILVPKSEMYKIEVAKNLNYGYVSFVEGSEYMQHPSQVTLKASYFSGYSFDGWTFDKYAYEGAQIVSTETTYSFIPTSKTTKIFANYSNKQGYTIVYDANGGTIAETGGTSFMVTDEFSEQFTLQQTLHANNKDANFVRDGYTAVGYSTKPTAYEDASTVNAIEGFSNMGGVCRVGASGSLNLYVVWAQNTPAEQFSVSEKKIRVIASDGKKESGDNYKSKDVYGYFITKYSGSDKIVVIPEEIDGVKVIGISANAFKGNVERVVIPKSVYEIASSAFTQCKHLREVVFFDSLQQVSNSSFPSTVSTVVLNSQTLPVYAGTAEGSFCIKYERVRTLNKKKIVVVSGSSTLNGLDSAKMEENFGGEYAVVNYGTNAGTQMAFYLDVISNYINEGDIIIHAPEFTSAAPMGDKTLHWKMFRGNNQCYDIFREVDMTRYANFWGAYCTFASDAEGNPAAVKTGKEYQHSSTGMNKYGDLSSNRPGPTAASWGKMSFNYNILTDERVALLNRISDNIVSKGGIMLMSFGTADMASFNTDQLNRTEFDSFTSYCVSRVKYPVISNVGTYIMPHELMYNSAWHCSTAGAAQRTEDLTKDLKAYLERTGSGNADISYNEPKVPEYDIDNGQYALIYFANGGKVEETGEEVCVSINSYNPAFAMQNTLEANDENYNFFVKAILL